MEKEKTAAERRKEVATLLFCSVYYLHGFGMLTKAETRKVLRKIRDYQDKYKIDVTIKQLDSVKIKYKD